MFTKKTDKPDLPLGSQSVSPSDESKDKADVQPPSLPNSTPVLSNRPSVVKGADKMASSSIIGPDLTIMGNAVSKGEVQVDGEIQGDIHCSSLLVGENATVTGGIVAGDVIVRGKVMGSIRGQRVTLQSSSHVEGDIYHQSLAIEQGAFFEGKSRRSEDPVGEVAKPGQGPEASNVSANGNGGDPAGLGTIPSLGTVASTTTN